MIDYKVEISVSELTALQNDRDRLRATLKTYDEELRHHGDAIYAGHTPPRARVLFQTATGHFFIVRNPKKIEMAMKNSWLQLPVFLKLPSLAHCSEGTDLLSEDLSDSSRGFKRVDLHCSNGGAVYLFKEVV